MRLLGGQLVGVIRAKKDSCRATTSRLCGRKLRLVPASRENRINKIAAKMKMVTPRWMTSPIRPVDARGFSDKQTIHLWNLCRGNLSGLPQPNFFGEFCAPVLISLALLNGRL
jgi:hypothetical protein